MAINTQGTLAAAVASWRARTDLTTQIPDFIVLAEAKLNRDLRDLLQETKSTSFSITAEYVNVPSSFLAVKSFQTAFGGDRYSLKLMPDEMQTDRYFAGTGAPRFYSIVGSQFRFAPIPDATYTATLIYYLALTALGSTSGNTNWVLTSYPDLYLYATLFEAAVYEQDKEAAQGYETLYQQFLTRAIGANNKNRWSGPGLATRPG